MHCNPADWVHFDHVDWPAHAAQHPGRTGARTRTTSRHGAPRQPHVQPARSRKELATRKIAVSATNPVGATVPVVGTASGVQPPNLITSTLVRLLATSLAARPQHARAPPRRTPANRHVAPPSVRHTSRHTPYTAHIVPEERYARLCCKRLPQRACIGPPLSIAPPACCGNATHPPVA